LVEKPIVAMGSQKSGPIVARLVDIHFILLSDVPMVPGACISSSFVFRNIGHLIILFGARWGRSYGIQQILQCGTASANPDIWQDEVGKIWKVMVPERNRNTDFVGYILGHLWLRRRFLGNNGSL
jgi:hypothetical protein